MKPFNFKRLMLSLAVTIAVMACSLGRANASSITTTFASNNNNAIGGANYFDVNVLASGGINVTRLFVNTLSTVGSNVTLNVYVRSGSSVGFEGTSAGWTLVSTGVGSAAGVNSPTLVDVTDFFLGVGVSGIAIHNSNYNSAYTNGTGSNQFYSNADLTLTMGKSSNVLFTPPQFDPRVWNGTIEYVSAVPEPSSLALMGIGAVCVMGWRLRKNKFSQSVQIA